jgi:hypothetical protein
MHEEVLGFWLSAGKFLANPTPNTRKPSKLAAIDSALSTCFFDADFHVSDPAVGKLLTNFAPDLIGDVFCQQLGAGVHKGQENHVLSWQ